MKTAGMIILVVGLVMTLYTGFTYFTREKIVDLGDIEITADKPHTVNWEPYVGVTLMVIGGALILYDRKKILAA